MEYGMQIVSVSILISILIAYFQSKHIPVLSTHFFTGFLLLAVFNGIMEFVTLYTVNHPFLVSYETLRLTHQLFIGSLDLMVMFLYLYIVAKTRRREHYHAYEWGIRCVPGLVALVFVAGGDLFYHFSSEVSYSYGPVVMTVYGSVVIYMLLLYIMIHNRKDRLSKKAVKNLYTGMSCWITIALIEFFFPHLLISSLGSVLMVHYVYISYENPRELLDNELEDAFNQNALLQVLKEHKKIGRQFYLLNMVLSDANILQSTVRMKELPHAMQASYEHMKKLCGKRNIYRPERNMLTVIFRSEVEAKQVLDKDLMLSENQRPLFYINAHGIERQLGYFYNTLSYPQNAASVSELMQTIEYIARMGMKRQIEGVLLADKELLAKKKERYQIEALLRDAIVNDGIDVYYQPIYSTLEKRFASAEALVRLKDTETLGYISPDIFIPIAEERGLIEKIGNIVFEKVCQVIAENRLWDKGIDYIEVNVSGMQIANERLAEVFHYYLDKYGVHSHHLNLEITETAAVDVAEHLLDNMMSLRKAGFTFSMDDFGTGYSNFAKMSEQAFELIKIDRSLILPCFGEEGEKPFIILDGCISMIKQLKLAIVAEGVETKEQADYLTGRGVEYLQGFYFSKPLPKQEFLAFIEKHNQSLIYND